MSFVLVSDDSIDLKKMTVTHTTHNTEGTFMFGLAFSFTQAWAIIWYQVHFSFFAKVQGGDPNIPGSFRGIVSKRNFYNTQGHIVWATQAPVLL